MTYNKRNQQLIKNPSLHALAIFQGVKSEKASSLLEEICYQRYKQLPAVTYTDAVSKYNKYCLVEGDSYVQYIDEPYINHKLGISIYNLLMMYEYNNPKINGRRDNDV